MRVSDFLVSVVVPTRNSERTLEACLVSVRSQQHHPIELIVVDNQSTDRTLEIAGHYADMVGSYGPERSAQRNRGAKLAHGAYLLFIDSDMTLSNNLVADCISTLRHNRGAPAAVVPEVSVGEGFLARCRALERSCYAGDNTIEAARFFTRSAFEAVGGYDEGLIGGEDWDLSLRVANDNDLPRATGLISHDEGHLRLGSVLKKKRYYAGSALVFWGKHRRISIGRANIVFRPALLRNWRRLARHPMLSAGIFSLKALETAAVTVGLVEAWSRDRRIRSRVRLR